MDQTSQPPGSAATDLHDLALQRYAMRLGSDYFIHMAGALVRANYGHLRTLLQGLRRGGEAMLPPQDPRWARPGD